MNDKVKALIAFFNDLDLSDFPPKVQISQGVQVVDVALFIESHLVVLQHPESAGNRILLQCVDRLEHFKNCILS